jgi:Bacterial Ig-like domain (group 3)/MBG domain (YGX type)/NHL repeat
MSESGGSGGGQFEVAAPGDSLGLVAEAANHTATLTLSDLPLFNFTTITATYFSSSGQNQGTGTLAGGLSVTSDPTSTSLAPVAPVVSGQVATLQATVTAVAPGAGVPTGTVTFFQGSTTLGTATLNSMGMATLFVPLGSSGPQDITATYSGEPDFLGSSGTIVAQVETPTTTTLTTSGNPSSLASPATLTATVVATVAGSAIPQGTVDFYAGSGLVASAPVDSQGHASAAPNLFVGPQELSAVFAPSSVDDLGSTSISIQQVVTAPGLQLTASTNTPAINQPVTFTVKQAGGPVSGTVIFYQLTPTGEVPLATVAIVNVSTLLFNQSFSVLGTYQIGASFTLSGAVAPLTYNILPGGLTVVPAPTLIASGSSGNPSTYLQPVRLTVQVLTPYGGGPTGLVQFSEGSSILGTVALTGGLASLTTSTLLPGDHQIAINYLGDTDDLPGSTLFDQVVSPVPTQTTVSSTPNHRFGVPLTFTATVTAQAPGPGIPTGQVEFLVDGQPFLATLDSSDMAEVTFDSGLSVGSHSVIAEYGADANFAPSQSQGLGFQVMQASTNTQVSTSASTTVFGQPAVFLAVVTPEGQGTPTGLVEFLADGQSIGTSPLGPGGIATLSDSSLSVGSHPVTAEYLGDANFLGGFSDDLFFQTVNPAASTVVLILASTLSPAFGEQVTFTAIDSATAPGSGVPTGFINFFDGTALLDTEPLVDGVASFTTLVLPVGDHSVYASSTSDGNFLASPISNPVALTVTPAPTASILTASTTASTYGDSIKFSVTVIASPATFIPAGTVTFNNGTAVLGIATLDALGNATLTTAPADLPAGMDSITATYLDFSGNNLPSTSQAIVVAVAQKALTVSVDSKTKVFGAPLPALSGRVTGLVSGDMISATFATIASNFSNVQGGGYTIVPILSDPFGRLSNYALTINPGILTIAVEGTTLALSGSPTNASPSQLPGTQFFGQSYTFTAVVSTIDSFGGVPTGTVNFLDGTTLLGTSTLSNGIASFSTTMLSVGSHTIFAQYLPGANFAAPSTTSLGVVDTVARAKTTATVAASVTSSTVGQSVSFRATVRAVAPGAGLPTGLVEFLVDNFALGAPVPLVAGQALTSTDKLTAGLHTITAFYLGSANFEMSPLATGTISILRTFAGTGNAGFSGDGGPAKQATFNQPSGLAADILGDVFIADTANNRIRMIASNGVITTVAGTGTAGDSGDGGPANKAELNHPTALTVDAQGDLFFADTGNNAIREITKGGMILTVIGSPGVGQPPVLAALDAPRGVVIDPNGLHLYVSDSGNDMVLEVMEAGQVEIPGALGGLAPRRVVPVAGTGSPGAGPNGPAVQSALDDPSGLALDSKGNLYIADTANNLVRMVTSSTGMIDTVAGKIGATENNDGGPATEAALHKPEDVAVNVLGNLYIADTGSNQIRVVGPDGTISSVISGNMQGTTFQAPSGITSSPGTSVFIANTNGNNILSILNIGGLPDNGGGGGGPGVDVFVGPLSSTLSSMNSIQLTSALLPLNFSALELLATLTVMSIEFNVDSSSEVSSVTGLPNQPPSTVSQGSSQGEGQETTEQTGPNEKAAPGVWSFIQYLLGLDPPAIQQAPAPSPLVSPTSGEGLGQGGLAPAPAAESGAFFDEAIQSMNLEGVSRAGLSSLELIDPADLTALASPGGPSWTMAVPLGLLAWNLQLRTLPGVTSPLGWAPPTKQRPRTSR